MQSEVLARLKAIIADAEADMAEHFSDAKETGERADLADAEVCLLVDDAKAIVVALSAQVQDVARDLPSEFEKWWEDAGHYVGGVVKMTYTQRKQLAWDAFYASANPAALAKQEGGHD